MKRDPFPLFWPDGWPRTRAGDRIKSRFGHKQSGQVSLSGARNLLLDELNRLGAANFVITSDLPTRNDGLPYADGRATDPGVAVWFMLPDARGNLQERVFPCDKWPSHAENMQAIAKSIEALRGLDRWGVGDVITRAFAGFNALPPGTDSTTPPQPVKRSWWEILDVGENLKAVLKPFEILAIAKARHREMIKGAHPDAGGSHDRAAELNAALAEAEAEMGA
jgi:hypothetical protein